MDLGINSMVDIIIFWSNKEVIYFILRENILIMAGLGCILKNKWLNLYASLDLILSSGSAFIDLDNIDFAQHSIIAP